MASTNFPGTPFLLNGTEFTIPSLSLRQFQDNYTALTAEVSPDEKLPAQITRLLPVILLAVNRNYPEITLDNLLDWVDVGTFRNLFLVVQGAQGLRRAEESGEAQPA